MNCRKVVSCFLCLTLVLYSLIPSVYATPVKETESANLVVGDENSIYYVQGGKYRYCIVVNTNTAESCFSILFTDNPDYLYEYYFTVDNASIDVDSPEYWASLLSALFEQHQYWSQVYIPDVVTDVTDGAETVGLNNSTRSISSAENEFSASLAEYLGTQEYTGRILATSYPNGIILHVYEKLKFVVEKAHSIVLSQAISVAGIIIGFFNVWVGAAVSAYAVYHSVVVESGTEIADYYVKAVYDRTVRRMDSDIWLNNARLNICFDGFYISYLEEPYAIDFNSREDFYEQGREYYEDLYTQLDDGYLNYIT